MEVAEYSRFFAGLGAVLALIYACAWLAKRTGLDKKLRGVAGGQGRLAVLDAIYLDPKRKLILVRADAREYVLLIHGESVTVLDKGEHAPAA
jgi:flagellar protein FliO/FliZ